MQPCCLRASKAGGGTGADPHSDPAVPSSLTKPVRLSLPGSCLSNRRRKLGWGGALEVWGSLPQPQWEDPFLQPEAEAESCWELGSSEALKVGGRDKSRASLSVVSQCPIASQTLTQLSLMHCHNGQTAWRGLRASRLQTKPQSPPTTLRLLPSPTGLAQKLSPHRVPQHPQDGTSPPAGSSRPAQGFSARPRCWPFFLGLEAFCLAACQRE